jgi:probable F420-dependent oxidoreductase
MARLSIRLGNDPQLSPQDYLDLASLADDGGYESLWMTEGAGRDALTLLTSIAMATEKLNVATGILPIYGRTPVITAMSASGLAAVSGGRFILGLGVGNRSSVESAHGIPFRRPLTRLRETITIVRRLLDGEQVTFKGKEFQVAGVSLGAAGPAGRVPIYIAALGPQMLELAGEMADGVLLSWAPPGYMAQVAEHVRRGAVKAGRDPSEIDIAGYVRVAVADNPDAIGAARSALQREIGRYSGNPFYRTFFRQMGFEAEMAVAEQALARGDVAGAEAAITPAMQDQLALLGSGGECGEELERIREAGLQQPVIAPFAVGDHAPSYRRAIEAFAQ